MTKRATIADIAQRAGLSKGAVSYALNGLPGVSEATRQRVLKLAAEMGWRPNSAARALSASRAGALGLVMARPASTLGVEPFFMKLLSGIENTLAARSTALLLQVVPDHDAEVEAYRRWWAERRVDGIFLIDLRVEEELRDAEWRAEHYSSAAERLEDMHEELGRVVAERTDRMWRPNLRSTHPAAEPK